MSTFINFHQNFFYPFLFNFPILFSKKPNKLLNHPNLILKPSFIPPILAKPTNYFNALSPKFSQTIISLPQINFSIINYSNALTLNPIKIYLNFTYSLSNLFLIKISHPSNSINHAPKKLFTHLTFSHFPNFLLKFAHITYYFFQILNLFQIN